MYVDGQWQEPTEGQLEARRRLLDHIDWLIRPPAWFFRQLETAIELAATGRAEEIVEVSCRRYRASEAIELWELEEFVERFGEEPEKPEEGEYPFDAQF